MKTLLHSYYFNLSNSEDAKDYATLCTILRRDRDRHFFNVWASPGGKPIYPVGTHEIELETKHLFSDQWNSTTARVFDWYEGIYPNRSIKQGHYLEITDEMREIRRTTLICGYCGKNYPQGHRREPPLSMFCDKCLDSPYLKQEDLHHLRLLPVALRFPKRDPLTDEEKTLLLPKYVEHQTTGRESRAVLRRAQLRERVNEKYNKTTHATQVEHAGMTWLLDRCINVDNCIYYSHVDKFCFGWQSPVSTAVKQELLQLLKEFPFAYEIKSTEVK